MTEEEVEKEEKNMKESFSEEEKDLIDIKDSKRNIIFICMVFIGTLSSLDGGIIPQQNSNIQKDFDPNAGESRVGLFGSIDYIGRVFGAIIFTLIMGRMNRKILLISTLIFKAITLFLEMYDINKKYPNDPTQNNDPTIQDVRYNTYIINIIARCLSGISQVFYTTYLPVWCDQYAKKAKKAIWVTLVQIGNPLGIILGYGIGMLCNILFDDKAWNIAFLLEGITLIVLAIIILFFDRLYFSEKFVLIDDYKGKEKEITEEQKKAKLINFSNLGKILCNKIFLFSSFCNSVAFFGIGVVQYYGNKYMEFVLEIGDSVRFVLFGILCLFGPTTGMVFGGIICSKIGGYVKSRSMAFVILCMAIASIISMCIACHEIMVLFIITGWSYLFAIGASIPPISGIIISCLDNNLRGDGFSFCNLLLNLLGSFPSSYTYSVLCDAFEDKGIKEKYKYAWMITMGYNFIGLLFVIIAGIFRFRIKGDLSEDNKVEELNNGNNTDTSNDENTENNSEEKYENI